MSEHTGAAAVDSYAYVDGKWNDGDTLILSTMSPASWLGSVVFDGARSIEGRAPDLDRHCQRVIESAKLLGMKPHMTAEEIQAIAWQGIAKFHVDSALYVRPMFFAGSGFIRPDPDSTKFALVVNNSPLPGFAGFSACVSSFRRPTPESAPTEAKASCLYPNVARCLAEAEDKGFDNAIVRDAAGNVAEFASANLWYAKGGVAYTPIPNGCFLNGITRQRVIALLRGAGVEVVEKRVTVDDVLDADEVFNTGNYGKVVPCTRVEDRDFQPGPIARQAYDLYFKFARSTPSPLHA